MSARNTSFYYSFLALPPEKRAAIVAVWDFCRAVDDAVDEATGASEADVRAEGERQVASWRRELAACYGDGTPCTPQGRALQRFVGTFGLPRDAFEAVIDGVAMDLERSRYATFDELREVLPAGGLGGRPRLHRDLLGTAIPALASTPWTSASPSS